MTVVSELKKLVKTITGKDATGNTIDELIAELNADYPEGGGDTGGVIVAELQETSEDVWVLVNNTPSELITAFDNKIPVYILVKGADTLVPVLSVNVDAGTIKAGVSVNTVGGLVTWYIHYENETWTVLFTTEKVNAPLVVHGTISDTTATITDDQITTEDIYAAAAAGKTVYFDSDDVDGGAQRHVLCGYAHVGAVYGATFSAITLMDDAEQATRLACEYIIFPAVGVSGMVYKKIIETV